jgi:hypothetical protein
MATLVLTAVGSAFGGPIGGAIGAALGQQIDGALFAPAAREGSRLKELAVQTSSYGTQISGIFGAMRVAGTVIWATDLIEERVKSGGGKGRASTVNYSYRVSLAAALSSRPVARLGRIWADGNLVRGSDGALKIDTQLRFYSGHSDQQPDPLLASAEAVGQCPAHRDVAYVVFEDLQLADFGNRIPSFTFEVVEREGPLSLPALFQSLSDSELLAESTHAIVGFAAGGANMREAIAPILDAFPVELITRDGNLVVRDVGATSDQPNQIVIAIEEDRRKLDPPSHRIAPAGEIPGNVWLRYYDPDRDYQAGVQHSNSKSGGRGEARLELPAVLSASSAKRLVELKAGSGRCARSTLTATVVTSAILRQPGDCFLSADGKKWQIDEIEHGIGTAQIKARIVARPVSLHQMIAAPGRHIPSVDQSIGETRIAIIDCPLIAERYANQAILAIFAGGTEAGWKRAALSIQNEGQLTDIGGTAPQAVIGTTQNALGSHSASLIDEMSSLEIELLNGSMLLANRDTHPLASDAPVFHVDGEFIRVGRVAALGAKRYRLSRFARACFSDQLSAPAHAAGSRIVLMDSASARLIAATDYHIGQTVTAEAQGLGDLNPVAGTAVANGRAITPLMPVHGWARRQTNGDIHLNWVRRSRLDLGWVDGVDQLMVEDREAYHVLIFADDNIVGDWTVLESALHISADDYADLGIPSDVEVRFSVQQIGRFTQSMPLLFALA